jgi:hypothetical protein
MIHGSAESKTHHQIFLNERMGRKKLCQELMDPGSDDAFGLSQIKIWLQRLKSGDFSCKDLSDAGQPPLTFGMQFEAFLPKYSFSDASEIAQQIFTIVPTVKEILQRELGMQKFTRGGFPII